MKVTTERTPNCNAVVTVEVDDDQVQRALKNAAVRVSRIRPIPGFRPGKAPYARVERAVGKDLLLDEAIDELAQSLYKQVLKDANIEPYDAGSVEVVQKQPVILKFTVPTRPVVTLGDYRSIYIQPEPVEVSAAEVNQVIERWRTEQATLVPVTRPVQLGDRITINVKGGIENQTQIDRESMEVQMEPEKLLFPWLEQLVGANANTPLSITYTYPADAAAPVAGKTATYAVTVTEIKETQLPELDDAFAQSISAFETLDQLKRRVRANLLAEKQDAENNRYADQVVDAVVAQAQIEYPDSMIEDELNVEVEQSKDLAKRLSLTWQKYLELAKQDESTYREASRPRAEKRLKRLLALMQVAEAEKLAVTAKDVDVEIDLRAQQDARAGGSAEQTRRALATSDSRRDIEFTLRLRKAIAFLVASAKGEPTSGKIVTPDMVLAERRARAQAAAAATAETGVSPSGLITDPSQVRAEDWPRGLDHPLLPGQE